MTLTGRVMSILGALCRWLLPLLLAFANSPANAAPAPTSIRVVLDDNYPPYIFRDSSGRMQGILKDLWDLWQQRSGIAVDFRPMDWGKARDMMESGQADVIDTIFETEARRKIYDFSRPYATIEVPIFFHQSISGIKDATSIKGFTVGVKDGDACIDFLKANGIDEFKRYASYEAEVKAAIRQEIRVLCIDKPAAVYFFNRQGAADEFRHSAPLYVGEFHWAVARGRSDLKQGVEEGFSRISPEERAAIETRWLGTKLDGGAGTGVGWYGGYALLAVSLVSATLFVWNWTLRRRVARRTAQFELANAEIRQDHQLQVALHEISEASHAARDMPGLLKAIHKIVGALMPANNFFVALYDERTREISFPYFVDENDPVPTPRKVGQGGLTERVLTTGKPLLLTQEMLKSGIQTEPSIGGTQSVDWLGVPLKAGKHTVGVLAVQSYSGLVRYTEKDEKLLRFVSDQVAMTIQRKQAESAGFESADQLRLIYDTANVAIFNLDTNGVITHANRYMAEMFSCSLDALIGSEYVAHLNPAERDVAQEKLRELFRESEISSIDLERRYMRHDGSEFWGHVKGKRKYDAEGRLVGEVAVIVDITERKLAESQIQSLAYSDPLTGLPNRRRLMDRLEHALAAADRHGHQDALLFVDLDEFKVLNDTLGHDKGDVLLEQIAHRLTACVREVDTVARLGGDEFIVLLEELDSDPRLAAKQAQAVAEKIHTALGQPYQLDGYGHHSSASIGVTLFGGAQGEGIEEPLKRAELAMYRAKAAGRNNLQFFEPEMRSAIRTRATLEADLRKAVSSGQFLLYYQPQGGRDDRLIGVEALVRWQHPERGLVSPVEFISIAEASGLILPLGRWVLKTACKQLALWAARPETAGLTMAVNVSARELRQPDFVDEVANVLEETGASPERLKLELTESVLVDNVEDIIIKMSALKAWGVGFSLDDFGTGYSSLSYLKRLPLDQLKIDQSFVRDILTDANDAAIAKMVVALADSLGLGVIAEGVESLEQRDFLANLGCHNYQGFLFSRPLPIDEFEVFAAGRARVL